jgi:hypothetical protein
MNGKFARDKQSTITFLGMTGEVCNFAVRQLMQTVIRVAGGNAAMSIAGADGAIGPLLTSPDKEFCGPVQRERYLDRLKRALGRADLAGLRAVCPAGFITEIPPEPGEPHCSADLAALAWRLETAERPVPMPFTIEPVAGKSFRRLLPVAAPSAAPAQSLPVEWIRWSPAARLPEEIGLKPAVDTPSKRVRSNRRGKISCASSRPGADLAAACEEKAQLPSGSYLSISPICAIVSPFFSDGTAPM